jgi:hypothetical protein
MHKGARGKPCAVAEARKGERGRRAKQLGFGIE